MSDTTPLHRIFVFGTLQEGHRNFHVNRGTRVGDHWVTAQPHPLYVIGPMRLPWLLNRPGQGVPVIGQLYAVDDAVLADMDRLERLDDPLWYERRRVAVRPHPGAADAAAEEVWVYFGSEAGFADQTVHAGPIDQYTLSVAGQFPVRMP
jgi:gamma-glutamylaminecyclotransferase